MIARALCVAVAALVAVVSLASLEAQNGGATASTLTDLERRLTAHADDIQAANADRHEVIAAGAYDRALRFFETLVGDNPRAANAYLNYGFAYVDKIPAAGSITQVILANAALTQFTRSIDLQPSWIGYYTRGNSYLYWPKIFGRAPLGVADLEEALRMQRRATKRRYHVRTFVALGDGYWKVDDLTRARSTWTQGLQEFPGYRPLEARIAADATTLARLIDEAFDPSKRVDTDLSELWTDQ